SEGIRECDRVPSDQAEGRRSEFLDRLPGRLHDRGQRRVPWGVRAELDGEKRWQREGVYALEPALELARGFELTLSNDDAGDDAGMRQAEEPRQQAPRRRVHVVVRLDAGQNKIVGQRSNRGRQEPRVLADIECEGIVVCEEETDAISSFPSEGEYRNVQAGIPIRRPRQRRCTTWSSQEIGFGLSSNEPASFRAGDWTSLIQSRSNHNPRGTMRPGPPN